MTADRFCRFTWRRLKSRAEYDLYRSQIFERTDFKLPQLHGKTYWLLFGFCTDSSKVLGASSPMAMGP